MNRMSAAWALGLSCVASLCGPGSVSAQFLPVELRALSRCVAQSGSSIEVSVVAGDRIDEIDRLVFSHPGITAEVMTADPLPFSSQRVLRYGQFTVKVAADVPYGRYDVRAVGRHGVSNPRAFLVTSLPCPTPAAAPSHDAMQPTPLSHQTVYCATSTTAEIDYFLIDLAPGQVIKIEMLAQQLDSRTIGYLQLFDNQGRSVAVARGADGFDPVLRFDSKSGGQYRLAVNDVLYRGGNEYPYSLVVRPNDDESSLVGSETAANEAQTAANGRLPSRWHASSFTIPVSMTFGPETRMTSEVETITLPHDASYWFAPRNDGNAFEFEAKEGDVYSLDVFSERMGEPTDARCTLKRIELLESGEVKLHDIQTADESQELGDVVMRLQSGDPSFLFKSPMTARYRLILHDLDVGESLVARQRYRLVIATPQPSFELVAYPINPQRDEAQSRPLGSKLFRGGAESIRVRAWRRGGFTGPIEVSVEGLPAGVRSAPVTIHDSQSQAMLTLVASDDAPAIVAPLRIVGRSVDGSVTKTAVPATLQHARGAGRDFIQSRIAAELYTNVSDRDLSPLTIELGDASDVKVNKGEAITVPIKLVRRAGGAAACVLRPRDLPTGMTAPEVTIAADQTDGTIEFKTAANTAPGRYSVWLQGETKVKLKLNPQALERAQAYRAELQKQLDDTAQAANAEAIKAAIPAADQAIEAAKPSANEQEITVFHPTNVITMTIQ